MALVNNDFANGFSISSKLNLIGIIYMFNFSIEILVKL